MRRGKCTRAGVGTMNGNVDDTRRLFLAAAAGVAAHQAQSALVEPRERPVRMLALLWLGAFAAAFWRAPRRVRAGIALAVGAGPVYGAVAGHLLPLVREGRVEPASETVALNLGGGMVLLALGVALLHHPDEPPG